MRQRFMVAADLSARHTDPTSKPSPVPSALVTMSTAMTPCAVAPTVPTPMASS